jgi:hypothetical protein
VGNHSLGIRVYRKGKDSYAVEKLASQTSRCRLLVEH